MKTLSTREFLQASNLHITTQDPNSQSLVKQIAKSKLFEVYCENGLKAEGKEAQDKSGLPQYKCRYCVKTYSSITRYEVHFRTHTGEKPYKCTYCEKKFNENGNLKAHLRIHTGERPFKCIFEECKLAFKTKGQLNDHCNRHSNLRPFKCNLCPSAFNRNNRLKIHMMIHSGEKPYQCTYEGCGKYFREKGNLMSHLKKHHHKQGQGQSQSQGQSQTESQAMDQGQVQGQAQGQGQGQDSDKTEAIKESCLNSTSSNNDSLCLSNGDGNETGLLKVLYDDEAEKQRNDPSNNVNVFDLNELNCYTYSDNQDGDN